MYQLSYQKDKNLFYIEAKGDIKLEEMIKVFNSILKHSTHNKKLLLFSDYRIAKIDKIDVEGIDTLSLFLKKTFIPQYPQIQWASLSFNYIPTTVALILKEHLNHENIEYEPFTTETKACEWMNINCPSEENSIHIPLEENPNLD